VRVIGPLSLLCLGVAVLLLHASAPRVWRALPAALWGASAASAAVGAVVIALPMAAPTFTMRDASRALAAGDRPRVFTGDLANTLAMETRAFAFVYRDLAASSLGTGWVNQDWRGLGATHLVSDRPPGQLGPRTPSPEGAVLESSYPVWPDRRGRPRITVYVSRLPR
jgi:hypothetical protein